MKAAISVKSPFSHNARFGFSAAPFGAVFISITLRFILMISGLALIRVRTTIVRRLGAGDHARASL